jgi:hypothetical protein
LTQQTVTETSVGDSADIAVIDNADGFAGLVGTVTPIVAK